MKTWLLGLALALLPWGARAQVVASPSEIDSLLAFSSVDSVAGRLGDQFLAAVDDLAPTMAEANRAVLAAAVAQGFAPEILRVDIANALRADAPPALVAAVLDARTTGALAELAGVAAGYTPSQSVVEFHAGFGAAALPRERVQLAVALVEAEGAGDFALHVGETVRQAAHRVVATLRGAPAPFVPIAPSDFQRDYRDRTLLHTIAFLHRHAPASDDLIRRATAEHTSEAGRWWVVGYPAAIATAVEAAAARVTRLVLPPAESAPPALSDAEARQPCRVEPCNVIVEWSGAPPPYNMTFGNAEELPDLLSRKLSEVGYQLGTERYDPDLITIVLRVRTMMGLCGYMSGTDNRGCPAIDQISVEFSGSAPGVKTPRGFTHRNRCGGEGVLPVDGLAYMLALRLDYAFTTFQGDPRPLPSC